MTSGPARPATQLPHEAAVKDLLSMVVGSEVTVQYAADATLDEDSTGAVAHYVDDEGVLRALVGCDLRVANALGAALALLPRSRVLEAVEAGEVPADIAENLQEVFNVGANLFNAPERPHLRLSTVLVGTQVSADVARMLAVAADRIDLDIDVPGFGAGAFAAVAAGPDSATREWPVAAPPAAAPASPARTVQPLLEVAPPVLDPVVPVALVAPAAAKAVLGAFDFEAPLPLPASAPRLVSRVQDVSPRIGVALSVASGRVVSVTCTGAERVSSGHLAQPGVTWCWVDCGVLGRAILAVPAKLTVVLADTFMGGSGAVTTTADRPAATTLEQRLVLRHLGPALQPLVLAFAGNGLTALAVGEAETHPLPASIGDLVALRLRTTIGDGIAEDTITLALPARALLPGSELALPPPRAATAAALAEVPVEVSLRLAPTVLSAADVEGLCTGDVVRLEHAVDRPLLGLLDDRVVLHATLGRRGRRSAVQIIDMLEG